MPRPLGWLRASIALITVVALATLVGCAFSLQPDLGPSTASRLQALFPADAVLLGEQHDNPDHQRIHREVVEALVARGELAALVLEMAVQGSTTPNTLNTADPRRLTEPDVRSALNWDDRAWSWADYKPAIMAAVRAGVPVVGANLPRSQMREAMRDASFDTRLSGPSLKAQQQLIRSGHCDLLPEAQVTPMTRMQIARDVAMAQTIVNAAQPSKTVVVLAGSGHVDRQLGVPQHLPASFNVAAVQLMANDSALAGGSKVTTDTAFDITWPTRAIPPKDYCAQLQPALQKQ